MELGYSKNESSSQEHLGVWCHAANPPVPHHFYWAAATLELVEDSSETWRQSVATFNSIWLLKIKSRPGRHYCPLQNVSPLLG